MGRLSRLLQSPAHLLARLSQSAKRIDDLADENRRLVKYARENLVKGDEVRSDVGELAAQVKSLRQELKGVKQELHDRMLQYHLQLGRLARAVDEDGGGDVRMSGRSVPVEGAEAEDLRWDDVAAGLPRPDPEGREWMALDRCPVCAHADRTVVNPWNKLILMAKAPDESSVRYDYAVCHGCGVLSATRRPSGERYRFMLAHFGEVTAKTGGTAEISNRLLNPYPLSDADRDHLRSLTRHGVFVSDHLGLKPSEYLAPLLSDRFGNSFHADVIGALLEPRGARVLEVRSRAGTILDALRRAYGAEVYAMPIWESQQFLLREVYGIETSGIIDFDHFDIPFDGSFDLIVCNHMFTHSLRPAEFFATLRSRLKPGGHLYLYNEPDDAEFLKGKQSMLATLNPLHMQAFDQKSLYRGLVTNGFEPVFMKSRDLNQFCLAKMADPHPVMMTDAERRSRVKAYERARDRAILAVDDHLRGRMAPEWSGAVERAVAEGVAEFDAEGKLRLVAR